MNTPANLTLRRRIAPLALALTAGLAFVGSMAMQPAEPPKERAAQPAEPRERQRPIERIRRGEQGRDGERPRDTDPGRPGEEGPPRRGGLNTPELAKAAIDRRLEEIERQRDRLSKLRERIAAGEDVQALQRELREGLAWGQFGSGPNAGGPGAGQGGGPQGGRPGPEERREVLQSIRDLRPDLADRIDQFTKETPVGGALLGRLMPRPGEIQRLLAEDPALLELKLDELSGSIEMMRQVRPLVELHLAGKSDSPEAGNHRAELRATVSQQYDIRGKIQERDVEALVDRLERLRRDIADRAAKREESIDRWIDELVKRGIEVARRLNQPKDPPPPDSPQNAPNGRPGPRPDNQPRPR